MGQKESETKRDRSDILKLDTEENGRVQNTESRWRERDSETMRQKKDRQSRDRVEVRDTDGLK